jgi:hypothetical protein
MSSPPNPEQRTTDPRFGACHDSRVLAAIFRQARWGAADHGQVLATAERIDPGDPDSWALEWIWTAGQAWAAGNAAAAAGRSARGGQAYLHVASHYGAALSTLPCSSEPDRWPALWHRHQQCWELAVQHSSPDARRLELPYGAGSLAAYLLLGLGRSQRATLIPKQESRKHENWGLL